MKAFEQFLKQYFPDGNYGTWLLAISGGVDSVVLGHLLKQNRIPFVLAHCNFRLRGAESDRDEAFVRQLADSWQVALSIKHFDTEAYAAKNKCSIQVAARQLRYNWFAEWAQEGHRYIATAHHANDSVETMLLNLMRGTGIEGLHGILARKGKLIRPLIMATKNEVLDYAKEAGLQWVDDSSNNINKYTRNYIRNEWLPAAEKAFPAAVKNMVGTIAKMQEAEQLYQQAIDQHKKRLLKLVDGEWRIPVMLLQKAQPLRTIVWELIKPFGFSEGQVGEVVKLCKAASGAYVSAADWRIIKHRNWLLVSPIAKVDATLEVWEEAIESIELPIGRMTKEIMDYQANVSIDTAPKSEALLDAKKIQFPLVCRPWRPGDYFYPLGMAKKKKVSRILIDLKLSKVEKEGIWVLESANRIVWVIGQRIDDRVKVMKTTNKILKINFTLHQ